MKNIVLSSSRENLKIGVDTLAAAVGITMGPSGQNVLIEQEDGPPIITKDGVTVAKAIELIDSEQNLAVQIIKEAAARTCDVAGDGTTTSTVLAAAIFNNGLAVMQNQKFAIPTIRDGMIWAANELNLQLEKKSKQINSNRELVQIASISANGETGIGDLIVDAITKVGVHGAIAVEEAKGTQTSLELVEGCEIDRGYLSPYFVTNSDRMVCEMKDCRVLLTNMKLSNLQQLIKLLEKIKNSRSELLIVADDVEGELMQALVLNKTKGALKVCAIKGPEFGEQRFHALEDLGIILNTSVIMNQTDLDSVDVKSLGFAKNIFVGRHKTLFVNAAGTKTVIEERLNAISKIKEQDDLSVLQRRMARLAGGVGVIRVGGATESELKERKDRIDDALHATRAAIEEGILPGGGVALYKSAEIVRRKLKLYTKNKSFLAGAEIILKGCEAPISQIIKNVGIRNPKTILSKLDVDLFEQGWDAQSREFKNLINAGIIDPAKVAKSALQNAVSAATSLLSVGCNITIAVKFVANEE